MTNITENYKAKEDVESHDQPCPAETRHTHKSLAKWRTQTIYISNLIERNFMENLNVCVYFREIPANFFENFNLTPEKYSEENNTLTKMYKRGPKVCKNLNKNNTFMKMIN